MRLTDASPPADVLQMARILAARYRPSGALERGDYVGAACLAFYEKRDPVAATARDFHALMVRSMDGAILNLLRGESRHQLGLSRAARSSVQGFASPTLGPPTGESASLLLVARPHRRRASRREHNRTYYFQHYEAHARRDYARHRLALGVRALPYEVWRERREQRRKHMASPPSLLHQEVA